MLNGEKSSGCNRCYTLEESGFRSMREEMNESFKSYFSLSDSTLPDGSISSMPLKYVDVRFSNLCNFKCRGCGPTLSSSWYEEHQVLFGYQSTEKKVRSISSNSPLFWEELKKRIPEADIIYFGGGEPLITQEHFEILSLLIAQKKFKTELLYNTNLSQLNYGNHNLSDLWSQFENVTLSISLDDIGKRAEYYRHGTKWEVIEGNLQNLVTQYPKINREVNCTVNIMNVFYLPELIRYLLDGKYIGPHFFNVNMLLDPVEYRVDNLPDEMKTKVTNKLTKFKFYLQGLGDDYSKLVRDLENVLKFMSQVDNSHNMYLFKTRTENLDALRRENFKEIYPELIELF